MQTMRRIDVQINGKLVGSCDSISKVSSPLFKDILDPWFDIKGFVPEKPSLNENQQIVFEWLKSIGKEMPIYRMADQMKWYIDYASTGKELSHALAALSEKEEFEVLAAFAQWGLEQEDVE